VTMNSAQSVSASFTRAPKSITVTKTGAGTGTVTSAPSGINCGSSCSASFADGTVVTLSAAADAGKTFTGWTGACSGTGPCQVTMSADQSVSAAFAVIATPTLPRAGHPAAPANRSAGGVLLTLTAALAVAGGLARLRRNQA
jgi:uncharacterized repeat protein (TIGR02543 family)